MSGSPLSLIAALAASLVVDPAAAQEPGRPATPSLSPPASPTAPPAEFAAGAEVLSVDGERLGVLVRVETAGGERLLHIRRPDGAMTTAPAVVASRGERAVVLDWTRAEFENPPQPVASETAAMTPPPRAF